ncbi:IclR family transcriptional regulator [Prauserella cavernicola]|uniref:IclR family transcriptional regulator n=1 Tax=Prauserella cavernicola TaxID=2800127 RepID=A0A934QZ07_9PSEU|nr:IclR family transcriptional regulator [Prauserella cavernicola]MBK1789151.1 IclR family transcriptional regulator [Prauserella cavernicola]
MTERSARAGQRERNPIAALSRVLAALAESEHDSVGVRELARILNSAPSSVHRTLAAAQEVSLVSPNAADRWELGWELHRIASLAARKTPYRAAAADILDDLATSTGESALLAVYDAKRLARMWVATAASKHSVRFVPRLYEWLPAHAGAGGLAILAHRPETELDELQRRGLGRFTETTITSRAELDQVLDQVRADGYRISRNEVNLGAVGVAAPITTHTGVTSSLALIVPQQRFTTAMERELPARVLNAAEKLAQRLGDPVFGLPHEGTES